MQISFQQFFAEGLDAVFFQKELSIVDGHAVDFIIIGESLEVIGHSLPTEGNPFSIMHPPFGAKATLVRAPVAGYIVQDA